MRFALRTMPLRARAQAAGRTLRRHKVASATLAVCVVGAVAAGSVGAQAGGPGRVADRTGPRAASFTLQALAHSGQHVSLSQYAGRPLIVNFFASWCGPCRKETPQLARFYRAEHGRVAVVGLDENDSASAARKFVRATGVTYPVGFDPAVQAGSAYRITGIPQTFFLDASHHVVKHVYGAVTRSELRAGTREISTANQAAG
jgi:cytochrome c biogenesis protein CcmG/thiol:disulfide interchange protein DsbE